MPEVKGIIFNIQKFSIHDGPGIRTLVFFKGCPLHCLWCCNPESQSMEPEHGYNPQKCFGCGRCIKRCDKGILSVGEDRRLLIRRNACHGECPECIKACPDKALTIYGKAYTVDEVMKVVEQDAIFYTRSGGGLSISGGEALMQQEFLLALLQESKKRRINTALETCAAVSQEKILSVIPYVDFLMVDIKHMDADEHKRLTGVPNQLILDNIRAIRKNFPSLSLRLRTPVIPGCNDSDENIMRSSEFAKEVAAEYELLEYHSMGVSKYDSLGRAYPAADVVPDPARFAELQKRFQSVSMAET